MKAQALEVLQRYCGEPLEQVPPAVLDVLKCSTNGKEPETETVVSHAVIGNNELAVDAAGRCATKMGYHCLSETNPADGEAEIVAKRLVGQVATMV